MRLVTNLLYSHSSSLLQAMPIIMERNYHEVSIRLSRGSALNNPYVYTHNSQGWRRSNAFKIHKGIRIFTNKKWTITWKHFQKQEVLTTTKKKNLYYSRSIYWRKKHNILFCIAFFITTNYYNSNIHATQLLLWVQRGFFLQYINLPY